MDGVIGVGFNGFIFKHGLELQPGLVGVGGEVVADQRGKCGVGELAGIDLLKANELLPAHKGLALGYGVGYLHAYVGHSGNNIAAAISFAVRAYKADVDGVNDLLALDAEAPAGVAGAPGTGSEVIGQGDGVELAYGGGQRVGAGLQLPVLVVRSGISAAVSEGHRGDEGVVLRGGPGDAVSVFKDAGHELAVIGHAHGELLGAGIILNPDLEQFSELISGGHSNAALYADGDAVFTGEYPLAVGPGEDEAVHLRLRGGGGVGTLNEVFGAVIQLDVLGHSRGYSVGINTFSLGNSTRGIAVVDKAESFIAVVDGPTIVLYEYFQLGKVVLIRTFFRREGHELTVQLVLLEREGKALLLALVADVLSLLVPAVESVTGIDGRPPEIIVEVADSPVFAVGINLFAGLIEHMIVDRELVPDHGYDVRPAVDVDFIEASGVLGAVGIFIIVPGSVVEPAFIIKAGGKLVGDVILADVQLGGVQRLSLAERINRDVNNWFARVAVLVDNYMYGLPVRSVRDIDVCPAVDRAVIGKLVAVPVPVVPLVADVAGTVKIHAGLVLV